MPYMLCPVGSLFTEKSNATTSYSIRAGSRHLRLLFKRKKWMALLWKKLAKANPIHTVFSMVKVRRAQSQQAWVWPPLSHSAMITGAPYTCPAWNRCSYGNCNLFSIWIMAPSQKPKCQQEIPEDYNWLKLTTKFISHHFIDIFLPMNSIGTRISKCYALR